MSSSTGTAGAHATDFRQPWQHKNTFPGMQYVVDDPFPNIMYVAIWMPASFVWLYYAIFSTLLAPLKKKTNKTGSGLGLRLAVLQQVHGHEHVCCPLNIISIIT